MKLNFIRNLTIIIVISILITLAFDLFLGGLLSNIKVILLNVLYGTIIGVTISFSGFFTQLILKNPNTQKHPTKAIMLLSILISVYITLDVFVVNAIWYKITRGASFFVVFTNSTLLVSTLITILIGLIIFFIILSTNFIGKILEAEKETQKAKDEASKFQYETLKNQINPHFLFNSLNVLSSLIHKDVERADEFTLDLANIYRYILDHQDDKVVSIEDELVFVNRYAKLQSIRFNQNFSINIDSPNSTGSKGIIPMALQLVIENVFKHNVVTEEQPMLVNINISEYLVTVSNPIQEKKIKDDSHQLGIANIKKRYELLTEQPCTFEKQNNIYEVKLPIIKIKH